MSLTIMIPKATTTAGKTRTPQYISPNSGSLTLTLLSNNGTSVTNTTAQGPFNLVGGASNPNCVAGSSSTTCTFTISAPTGTDIFLANTYTSTNGTGPALGSGSILVNVRLNAANVANLTLTGPVASVQLVSAQTTLYNGNPPPANYENSSSINRSSVAAAIKARLATRLAAGLTRNTSGASPPITPPAATLTTSRMFVIALDAANNQIINPTTFDVPITLALSLNGSPAGSVTLGVTYAGLSTSDSGSATTSTDGGTVTIYAPSDIVTLAITGSATSTTPLAPTIVARYTPQGGTLQTTAPLTYALLIPPPDAVLQTSATHNTPDVVNVAMTETMAVTNTGNAPTSGTIYAYVFLQNVTLNNTNGSDPSWTCSNYGYEYCTSNATITPNASLPLVFNVTPTAATGYVDFSADGGAASNGSSGAEITDYYSAASTPTAALTLNISANPTTFYATVAEAYTLGVNNVGTAATSGTITLTDTLPADVAYDSFTGTNWICSASLPTVTCTYPTSIAAGNSASSLTVTVTPGQSLAGQTVQNSATLTGGSAANVGPVQTSVYVSSPITFTGVTGFNVTAGSGNAFTAGDSAVLAFGSIPSPSFDGNVLIAAQNGFTGNYTVASNSCATENEISTTFVNGLAATAASGTTPVSYPLSVVGPSPAPCAVTIQDGSGNTATLNVDLSQSSVTVESQRRHSGSTVR